MAAEDDNQPLSLNQRHSRFLRRISASQSHHRHGHVGNEVDDGGRLESVESVKRNGDIPRFDLGTPSPSVEVNVQGKHIDAENGKDSEREDNAAFVNPSQADAGFPGETKQTKVRIQGRNRLCKITKDDDCREISTKDASTVREPQLEDISDFSSPVPVDKSWENGPDEIRDIWNELSSRLGALSIDKNKVDKKVDSHEYHQNSARSVPINESIQSNSDKFEVSASYVLSSDSEEEIVYISREDQKEKPRHDEFKATGNIREVNRTSYTSRAENNNAFTINHMKSGSIKVSDSHKFKTGKGNVVLKEGRTVKETNKRSDEESSDVTELDDHMDDLILSGPKYVYRLPGKIAKILYPHQLEGLKWLWSLHCKGKGGILGDDMGLGKTMQICSFLAGLFHEKLIRRVLIVAPKTLLTHWLNELSMVGLAQKTREYFATCPKTRHYELQYVLQDKGLLLTTYDIVRNNVKSLCGNRHDVEEDEVTWDYMILDEGHLIKNPSTQRAKSLLQIPCLRRIIISGTPLQNNLKELWALFSFCCPDLLGDKKEFKEKYEYFINRGNEKNASDREKRIGSSVAKDLRDCIQPYFLRRLKSEVFGDSSTLSKKNEIIVWLRLTKCQRQLYEAFLRSEIVISACDGSPLAAITILKKICDHPLLLTKRAAEDVLEGMDSFTNQEDHSVAERLAMHVADVADRFEISENHDISCKISFILSLLGDLIPKGHNVLIFSQTRKMLNLIQETLISNHYKCMRIDGTTKSSDRAMLIKDFQEGRGAPIFLLTSQVGGLGLTLTNADRVIVVDPAWNPSTDNQSVDRAYRIGQKKDVIVYRLMTCGTVEEKIYRKQVFKGGLFKSATEHQDQIRYFSQQDLRDLFSLPKQGFDVSATQQQLLEEHDDQHRMEESLRTHVDFLETLKIAGVSQHSLLFSKTAPVQALGREEEQELQRQRNAFAGSTSSRSSSEVYVDGARFAFNPKDTSKFKRDSSVEVMEPSESEIQASINRLSKMLEDQVMISGLPDKGAKLHKKIAALNLQLHKMRLETYSSDY